MVTQRLILLSFLITCSYSTASQRHDLVNNEVYSYTSENIIKIPLIRTESALQRMARENIHPRVIESFFLKAAKNGSGVPVPLFKFLDTEFYGEILIGHPGQKFKVVFDTAWANTWIPSVLCPVVQVACILRNKYDASRSSTYVKNNKPFDIKMGAFELKGKLSTDLFHINQVNVTNVTFAEIDEIPWILFFSKADGVVGLAFADYAVDGVIPLFYNMIKQGIVDQRIFSFYMNRDPSSPKGGTIMFGGVEKRHYLGNFTDVQINPKTGLWTFQIDGIFTSRKKSDRFCTEGCEAFADTSENTIRGPADDIDMLNSIIGAQSFYFGRYIVNCNSVNRLPTVTFFIKNRNFTLKGNDYIQKMTWGPVTICLSSFKKSETPDTWALGAAFLSRYYVRFDMQRMMIGFADARL
uniref:Secreted Aspartyl glucosaminidase-like protein n=1 Tax=Pristhesancus plagipennis TaxID=1955184 RepID=A0A2K8JLZ3_PRIPG|nr:secreted Aspartyl glucosaminidase-like protein [Pristhesancus plagipennis]